MPSPYLTLLFSAVLTACAIGIVVDGVRSVADGAVLLLVVTHARTTYQKAYWGFLKQRFLRRLAQMFHDARSKPDQVDEVDREP